MAARAVKDGDRTAANAARGRHVIDLTDSAPPADRVADYREAFGFPSSLHEVPEPAAAIPRRISRLSWRRKGRRSR